MKTPSASLLLSRWTLFLTAILLSSHEPQRCFGVDDSSLKKPIRKTEVSIVGNEFHINGKPTYADRAWSGQKIQGLLMNSRMVQGIFDDRNPETVARWAYPDTGKWDPDRNTREFLAAMPEWRRHGLLAFTINLQGGSPQGYSKGQPWHTSAIEADGSLRSDYMSRLEQILDNADDLGMVVILGYFYFGQDQWVRDEAAVIRAVDNSTRWLLDRGYRNVMVEINNECDVKSYDHAILKPDRIHELIERVKGIQRDERRCLVGTSYGGGSIPKENVIRTSDFLLMHGNGVSNPDRISEMIQLARKVPGYSPKPILFNEDDHFDFEKPKNNFVSAIGEYASWGYFDPGKSDYADGYQCPPVNWSINTDRKLAFFKLLKEITGSEPSATSKVLDTIATHRITYHSWPDSLILTSANAEVIIVPAIGRVMQFRFKGEKDGPFWENRALDGQAPDPKSNEWGNFGGDKTWPSPQAEWQKVAKRGWPPPPAFDSMPVQATVNGSEVTLISPVDPHYGIRTHRRITLHPSKPVMTISTTFEKLEGEPKKVGIWVITQLKDPVDVFARVPKNSLYPSGYNKQSDELPLNFKIGMSLLSLARNPKASHKVGTDAGTLLWVGEKAMVRIDSPRLPGGQYPDAGSSAEIYTNPDPLTYVELELLGPLHTMRIGDKIESTSVYTLLRRTAADPDSEARKILSQP